MKKLLSVMLALVVFFSLPTQAHAEGLQFYIPEEFNFSVTAEIDFDIPEEFDSEMHVMLSMLGGLPARLTATGGVSQEGNFVGMSYFDINLADSIIADPIRFWMDIDLSDLDNPTVLGVLELPPLFRILLAASFDPVFRRPFMVIDMLELFGEGLEITHLEYTLNDDGYITQSELLIEVVYDFDNDFTANFSLNASFEIYDIDDTTIADFPVLTRNNSFNINNFNITSLMEGF